MYEKISLFSFNIMTVISNCCVALLCLRFCISLENLSLVSNLKENVYFELFIPVLIINIVGYLENFPKDWRLDQFEMFQK